MRACPVYTRCGAGCRECAGAAGIKPGFYHGAMNNAFLGVHSGRAQRPTSMGPYMPGVTQDQYTKILLANLRQLWTGTSGCDAKALPLCRRAATKQQGAAGISRSSAQWHQCWVWWGWGV